MKIKDIVLKHRQKILYLIFGVATTLINVIIYWLLDLLLCSISLSTIIAWIFSVVFAYITNKIYVFESRKRSFNAIAKESAMFFVSRIATGILDLLIMVLLVDFFMFNGLVVKILSNVIVIILNYILSKFFVFRLKR